MKPATLLQAVHEGQSLAKDVLAVSLEEILRESTKIGGDHDRTRVAEFANLARRAEGLLHMEIQRPPRPRPESEEPKKAPKHGLGRKGSKAIILGYSKRRVKKHPKSVAPALPKEERISLMVSILKAKEWVTRAQMAKEMGLKINSIGPLMMGVREAGNVVETDATSARGGQGRGYHLVKAA